jgi:beta propeller repeat protein
MDKRSGNWDIYMNDLATGKESSISTGVGDQAFPSIDGDIVAFADNRTGDFDIAIYDLSTRNLTHLTKPGVQTAPVVSGRYVAYHNNGSEVYLYDIDTGLDALLIPGSAKMEPAIGERGVVWSDYRAGVGDPDIYMYDFSILADIPVTSGAYNHTNPSVFGERVVWTDDRTGHYQIYMMNLSTMTERNITQDSIDHSSAGISSDYIIYSDNRTGNLDVFLYDLAKGSESQISRDASNQRYAMVDGSRAAWVDDRSGNDQIYVYEIASGKESQITSQKSVKNAPVISGERVVWVDDRNGNWDIYSFNLTSGTEFAVCTNPKRQASPWVNGDMVVWADGRNGDKDVLNWDIYAYNLTTGVEMPIVTNSANQGWPCVYGKYIAWRDTRGGDSDIYLYDMDRAVEVPVATKPLSQAPNDNVGNPEKVKPYGSSQILSESIVAWMDDSTGPAQINARYIRSEPRLLLSTDFPSTNGSLMLWSDNRRGNWDIYGFDFFSRAEVPICRADGDQLYPRSSGDLVVWSDYRNGDSDIWMKNLTTGQEKAVAEGKGDQVWASISGNKIVWMDNETGDFDIKMYEIGTGTTESIHKGPGQQMYPIISGDMVVWQDNRGGDFDVYAYYISNKSESKLTDKGDQVYPDISGRTIVWEDSTTGDISYYLFDKKWGRAYPRPGIQSSPTVAGSKVAYSEKGDSGWSIHTLDVNTWKDELVAAGPGQVKPDLDKKLVWLNSLTARPRYESVSTGQISAICKAPGDQSHPVVSGNYVVWQDNRSGNPDVYVYSLSQEVELPLDAGPYQSMYPDISGNIIAWDAYDMTKESWGIRTFDVSIDNRTELVSGLSSPSKVSLSDQYLAYSDLPIASFGWRVYKKFLYGIESREAIPPSGTNTDAGGSLVVYQDNKASGNWDIWLWKTQGRSALTKDPNDQTNPATDGLTVVWQDNRNGNWDIYAYDLNTSKEIRVTSAPGDETLPDVENGVIVWQDNRNGNWDIFSYNLKTKKEMPICADDGDQTEPRIGSRKIVWTDSRGDDQDIYIYENYMD